MTSELDRHDLHAETKAKTGKIIFTRILGGSDLAFDTALAESTRNHNSIEFAESTIGSHCLDVLGLHPLDRNIGRMKEAAVLQRFNDGEIRIGQGDVLSDNSDTNRDR